MYPTVSGIWGTSSMNSYHSTLREHQLHNISFEMVMHAHMPRISHIHFPQIQGQKYSASIAILLQSSFILIFEISLELSSLKFFLSLFLLNYWFFLSSLKVGSFCPL